MAIGGVGALEIIIVLVVILLFVGLPIAAVVAVVLFLVRRSKNANAAGMKKCPFCAMSIKSEAIVCHYCGREVAQ